MAKTLKAGQGGDKEKAPFIRKKGGTFKPFPNNPRDISEEELAALEGSMERYGSLDGIVVNLSPGKYYGAVVCGNQKAVHIGLDKAQRFISDEFETPTAAGTTAQGFVLYKGEKYPYREVHWTDRQCEIANIRSNNYGGHNNTEKLWEFSGEVLQEAGIDMVYEEGLSAMREQYYRQEEEENTKTPPGGDDADKDYTKRTSKPKDPDPNARGSFEVSLPESDRRILVETLDQIRQDEGYDDLGQALMHIVNRYNAVPDGE